MVIKQLLKQLKQSNQLKREHVPIASMFDNCKLNAKNICVIFGLCSPHNYNSSIFNSYHMGTSGLPDMYTRGCTYQANHECPCYNYYVTPLTWASLNPH